MGGWEIWHDSPQKVDWGMTTDGVERDGVPDNLVEGSTTQREFWRQNNGLGGDDTGLRHDQECGSPFTSIFTTFRYVRNLFV